MRMRSRRRPLSGGGGGSTAAVPRHIGPQIVRCRVDPSATPCTTLPRTRLADPFAVLQLGPRPTRATEGTVHGHQCKTKCRPAQRTARARRWRVPHGGGGGDAMSFSSHLRGASRAVGAGCLFAPMRPSGPPVATRTGRVTRTRLLLRYTATAPPPPRDAFRREGTTEATRGAVRWAVAGGCQSGWGRLLSDKWH